MKLEGEPERSIPFKIFEKWSALKSGARKFKT